ncbi:porin [uncultured Shewanella sp.]|uniref:porin n=1 Tax=uncultured Shewanella sp. TaxID=173975 RepID=UPI002638BE5C|nr:porin [uncultured Shewanella sp.]
MKKTILAGLLTTLLSAPIVFAADNTEDLRKTIKQQQQVLDELERRLNETEKRVERTADVVDNSTSSKSATTIGGYGELHYNNIENNQTNTRHEEIDFHRFVLFFNHEFTANTRFFSEVELEHSVSGDGQNGEVELEQAYVEHDFNQMLSGKAGLFLIPVGILNETHEPATFYGVERNPVETNIIPTTWWEGGLALNILAMPGLVFDAAMTSGLNVPTTGDNAYNIRSGRQKVSEAIASDFAYTARIKYTAIPGLELAATAQYQSDITQGAAGVDSAPAMLLTGHVIYTIEKFTIKALIANWNIDSRQAEALGKDKQDGYFIEPSYRFNESVGVFARYNEYDTQAGMNDDTLVKQTNVGINYWLHENVVFKADYENQGGANDADGFNLGVGYQF